MTNKEYAIAKTLKERLTAVIDLLDLRVFGSRARDDGDEFSDMDVFVEVASLNRQLRKRMREIAWEIGFENLVVISLLVFTREDIESSPLRLSPILQTVLEEGVPL